MKLNLLRLTVVMLALGVVSLIAQVVTTKKLGVENRLAQALQLFPDADANKDGTLSIEEALLYVDLHPEVKDKLRGKQGSQVSSKPATFAPGAEGTKVFVCAHSFMIYTAGMLPAISKSAGTGGFEPLTVPGSGSALTSSRRATSSAHARPEPNA